jgi:DNA invertase Pin-like site-specific DNA recombinase
MVAGKGVIVIKQQSYNVGIYARLSRDDEREGESLSIENQKEILIKHVREQRWNLVDTYLDDGYSGKDFERPGVQRLIEDAKDGKINLILCKDLSRFGRNYILTGQYVDYLFPMINCRFIALHDGVDTINNDNDIMPFKNLFNEFYLRDVSKKVRNLFRSYQQQGLHLSSAPYGYRKTSEDKHRLVVDEYAAGIVRRIFVMRRGGMGYHSIARILNEEAILLPLEYRIQNSGKDDAPGRQKYFWNYTSVHALIRSEAYIGHTVQHKKQTVSYKNKKLLSVPKDEWIKVEDTHEPIVDLDTFRFCAELDEKNRRPRQTRSGDIALFSGFLTCMDCGGAMRANIQKIMRKTGLKTYVGYCCGTYSRCGKSVCSVNMIREHAVAAFVLDDIRKHAQGIALNEDALRQELLRQRNAENEKRQKTDREQVKALQKRLSELERLISGLYEDKILGNLSESVCHSMIGKYEREQAEKAEALRVVNERLALLARDERDVDSFIAAIRKYVAVERLDREMLLELVDHIEIGKSTGHAASKDKTRDIVIHYKFVGHIHTVIPYLQITWVGMMNNIRATAEETILTELIYS